jgi:PQQ system protein
VVSYSKLVVLAALAVSLCGCTYVRLLRPSIVSQLNPPVARLINEVPEIDQPNDLVLAKLYALGGHATAREGPDGIMRVKVSVPKDEYIWRPAIITMPRGGTLELEFTNLDDEIHMAVMPSNGAQQLLRLPVHTAGKMRIQLDGPGWYWFHCPVANHYGRGMFGYVLVGGKVPVEARLDRPSQPLPRD